MARTCSNMDGSNFEGASAVCASLLLHALLIAVLNTPSALSLLIGKETRFDLFWISPQGAAMPLPATAAAPGEEEPEQAVPEKGGRPMEAPAVASREVEAVGEEEDDDGEAADTASAHETRAEEPQVQMAMTSPSPALPLRGRGPSNTAGPAPLPAQKTARTNAAGTTSPPSQKMAKPDATGATSPPMQKMAKPDAAGATSPPLQKIAKADATGATFPPLQKMAKPDAAGATSPPLLNIANADATGATFPPLQKMAKPDAAGATSPPLRRGDRGDLNSSVRPKTVAARKIPVKRAAAAPLHKEPLGQVKAKSPAPIPAATPARESVGAKEATSLSRPGQEEGGGRASGRLATPKEAPPATKAANLPSVTVAAKEDIRAKPSDKPPVPKGMAIPSLRGDLKMVVTGNSGVKLAILFREYPKSRRNAVQSKSEARRVQKVAPVVVRTREETREAVIEKAREGIYIFVAEAEKGETARASFTLKVFESGSREKVAAIGARSVGDKTVLARVLMPEGILWDDDSAFTGSLEDSESTTKFNAQTGIFWKEYND